VGSRGTILHYANGAWHPDTLDGPVSTDWRSVAFSLDATTGWAVGGQGAIARYLGKHRWKEVPSVGVPDTLVSIWLDQVGAEGYAVGTGGQVLSLAGDQWSKLTLPRGSGVDLTAVAANEDELWIRDHVGRVSVYSRRGNQWLRELGDIDASMVWGQPSPYTVWIAGVTYTLMPDGRRRAQLSRRYTIRWSTGERTDSVNRVPLMPEAAAMSRTHRCGVVAGSRPEEGEKASLTLAYIDAGRSHVLRRNPPTAVRGVWVNEQCTDGWLVGTHGLLSRLRFTPLRMTRLMWRGESLEKLTGEFRLVLSPVRDSVSLDSMQLVADGGSVLLLPGRDFKVERVGADTIKFELFDSVPARAAALSGESLRLRFFTSYALSDPAYRAGHETAQPFKFEKKPWWRTLSPPQWGIVGLLTYIALSLFLVGFAIPFEWPRRLLLMPRPLFNRDWGQLVFIFSRELVDSVPVVRDRLFSTYRSSALKKFSPPPPVSWALALEEKCAWLQGGQRRFPDPGSLYSEFRKERKDRVLWITHAGSSDGESVLRSLMHAALQSGEIAFFVIVDDAEPILTKIGRAMERFGKIPKEATWLIERGRYVIVLNAFAMDTVPPEMRTFIEDFRLRNSIIVGSSMLPAVDEACVVSLEAGQKVGQ
jgi:hypothetical protein